MGSRNLGRLGATSPHRRAPINSYPPEGTNHFRGITIHLTASVSTPSDSRMSRYVSRHRSPPA
nr:MAG TPA: hypothetical protein [Caudoviricetes sp.]